MRSDRVDQALAEGKLWRAKEILEGQLSTPDFDRELLLKYGRVLLAMGDLLAAGRVLFFSGYRDAEFQEAIELFLSRHPRSNRNRFAGSIPSMIRRQAHLAEYVASEEFELSGWSDEALQSIKPHRIPIKRERPSPLRQKLRSIVAAAIAVVLVLVLLAGVVSVGKVIISLF
jgi:hypothetical protein